MLVVLKFVNALVKLAPLLASLISTLRRGGPERGAHQAGENDVDERMKAVLDRMRKVFEAKWEGKDHRGEDDAPRPNKASPDGGDDTDPDSLWLRRNGWLPAGLMSTNRGSLLLGAARGIFSPALPSNPYPGPTKIVTKPFVL